MIAEEKGGESISWNCWLRTIFAGSGAIMYFVFNGITEAQSSTMLPQLKEEGSFISVTPDEETWIASLGAVTTPVSSLLVGPSIDYFGRKKVLLFFYVNIGVGFGIIACATEVYHIYIGRIVCSFGLGFEVVSVVYLSEICTKKQRRILLSLGGAMFTSGCVISYLVGGFLPWNIASAIYCVACFVYFIIQCFTPESPAWLYKKGRTNDSTISLRRLGRSQSSIFRELEQLKISTEEENEKITLKTFLKPTVWKPFVILTLYHFLLCGTCAHHVMYYTVDYIERLGTTYDSLNIGILTSVVRVLANCTLGLFFMSVVGRKFTTSFSGFWMTVGSIGAGVYEYMFRDVRATERPVQWVPVSFFMIYLVGGIIGVTNLPWLMGGEMFPLRFRGSMTGAVFVVAFSMMFVVIKLYAFMMEALHIYGVLFFSAISSFLIIFFGIYILPETQNKTLNEIERSFLPKKRQSHLSTSEEQIKTIT